MSGKTVCFFGHSEILGNMDEISHALTDAIERHITKYGVTEFLVGNYGSFDRMAASAVKAVKARYPDIHLYLMLPYHPEQGRSMPDMEGFDNAVYPFELVGVPHRLAIPRLNRLMVADADYAIAYVVYAWGGAATTLKYAEARQRKGLMRIENLAETI